MGRKTTISRGEPSNLRVYRRFFALACLSLVRIAPLVASFSIASPRIIRPRSLSSSNYASFKRKLPACRGGSNDDLSDPSKPDENETLKGTALPQVKASKRQMLGFALPALGIVLCNPLLSNIDNVFVGHTVGTAGLAALSPATICTDQMLYLFSFLSRATTGLVSRAYATNNDSNQGNVTAAREAGSAPLTVSLICGVFLSIGYALFTPQMLTLFQVDPSLRASAAAYIYWRGAISWAALVQMVSLSIMLATRDSITPLKIVGLAALLNVIGDALLCVWPLRWGCAGAAAATAGATLVSSAYMIHALKKKELLPKIRLPTKTELNGLLEFVGPLFAITITRLIGTTVMQRSAMKLGVQPLAAYQLSMNLLVLFLLFGEPLSQLAQTDLPALVDSNDGDAVWATFQSILTLGGFAALGVGGLAFLFIMFGSGLFTADPVVQLLAKNVAPTVFVTVAIAIFTVALDGAMLASRDFNFLLFMGTFSSVLQIGLLQYCTSLSAVFGTFALRLGVYSIAALGRIALGHGVLGRVIRNRKGKVTASAAMG